MRQLTLCEKISIVRWYYKHNEDYDVVKGEFLRKYDVNGVRIRDLTAFAEVINRFEEYGSVTDIMYLHSEGDIVEISPEVLTEDILIEPALEVTEATNLETETPDRADKEVKTEKVNPKQSTLKEKVPLLNDNPSGIHICKLCSKIFEKAKYLTKHLKTHQDDRPHVCPICQCGFKTPSNLKNHQLSHVPLAERKQLQCPVCQKMLPGQIALRKHKRIHTGEKNYVCEWCAKAFLKPMDLKIHLRVHTGEKPYQCNVCDKAFSSHDSRKRHSRIHTGERPFKCDDCDKSFIDNSALVVHKRQHTGESPYKCHLCSKTCKQGQNLRSHIRRVHAKEMIKKKVKAD